MCNRRKQIYTTASKLYYNRYQKYVLSIPCGKCSECEQDYINEWEARTYYEAKQCLDNGGYILFDGLSYKEDNVPRIANQEKNVPHDLNFMCFNRKNIQLFLKRLRSNLKAKKIDSRGLIRYMIASEYGQDETYTLRPHHHLLIFCNANIAAASMSMEIKKAWGLGRTSGIEDKGAEWFNKKGLITSKESAIKVAHYIGKYCLKNQEYDKVADAKCKAITKFWYELENATEITERELFKKPEWRKKKRDLLRNICTFHVQSQGYGINALNEKNAIHNDMLGTPNTKKIWWWQRLPQYYIRKLYYEYEKINGKIIWKLSAAGLEWKKKNLQNTIYAVAKKMKEKEAFAQSEEFRRIILENQLANRKLMDDTRWYQLNDLLYTYRDERKWEDYAEYILYHKGRIWDGKNFIPKEISVITTHNANTMAELEKNDVDLIYNYVHEVQKDKLHGKSLVSPRDMSKNNYRQIGDELRPQQFEKIYCINEDTDEKWHDFDKLTGVIDTIDWYIEETAMRATKIKREGEKLSNLGFYKATHL